MSSPYALKRHQSNKHKLEVLRELRTVKAKSVNAVKDMKCRQCPFKSSTRRSLREHVSNMHSTKKSICAICTSNTEFKCELCEFSSKASGKLQRHILRIHMKTVKTHICTESYLGIQCDYKTYGSWHLIRHMKAVPFKTKDKNDYPCSLCSYTGMSKALLADHLKAKHGITLIKLINP